LGPCLAYCKAVSAAGADATLTPEPVIPRRYVRFTGDHAETVVAEVIGEIRLTIRVDGTELVTLMCSPWQLRPLVVGFLYLEGLIDGPDAIDLLRACVEDRPAYVRLTHGYPAAPPRKIVPSGCTGGVSFANTAANVPNSQNLSSGSAIGPP